MLWQQKNVPEPVSTAAEAFRDVHGSSAVKATSCRRRLTKPMFAEAPAGANLFTLSGDLGAACRCGATQRLNDMKENKEQLTCFHTQTELQLRPHHTCSPPSRTHTDPSASGRDHRPTNPPTFSFCSLLQLRLLGHLNSIHEFYISLVQIFIKSRRRTFRIVSSPSSTCSCSAAMVDTALASCAKPPFGIQRVLACSMFD